jgi:hypothetical protein
MIDFRGLIFALPFAAIVVALPFVAIGYFLPHSAFLSVLLLILGIPLGITALVGFAFLFYETYR